MVGLGTLVVPMDTSVNVAFPYIIEHFGLPISAIQWVVIAYVLTHASLMLIFGRIGDIFGHRRVFLFGSAWSAGAFLICALAPSYPWLLAARALQGVGAAMLLSCGAAIATGLFAEHQRARVLGIYTMMFGLGSALGPPVAGLLVAEWGWSAVFTFRMPICVIAFALVWLLPEMPRSEVRESFDGAGALLFVVAVSAGLLALNELQDLKQGVVPLFLLAGVAGLAAAGFIRREHSIDRPLIDLQYFRDGSFSLANLGNTVVNLGGFSVMLLMPFYLARTAELSAPAFGAVLAASATGTMVVAPLAGWLSGRISPHRLLLLGTLLVACGLAALGFFSAGGNMVILVAAMAVQGIGLGIFQVAYFEIVTGTLPQKARGVAGSLGMMTRTLGVVSGASLLMLVFESLRGAALTQDAEGAFLAGLQGTFLFAAGLCTALLLAALWRGWLRDPVRPAVRR